MVDSILIPNNILNIRFYSLSHRRWSVKSQNTEYVPFYQ